MPETTLPETGRPETGLPQTGPPAGVLVTRPEPEAHDTALRIAAMGFLPILAPSLRIVPRAVDLSRIGRVQAVLVTSGNALPALPPNFHATPLLTVGDATAARARAAGFWRVSSAGRDAAALADTVTLACDPGRGKLLQLSGEAAGLGLLAALRGRGFQVVRRVAYAARPLPSLPPDAWAAVLRGEVRTALFFSPATAHGFVRLMQRRRPETAALLASVTAVAISPATAAALTPLPWRDIRVASRPNQDELLAWLR